MQKKFVVIDGSSLLYRAFYALPLLATASGQYTNAIYGFANMLTKLIGDLKPDMLVIAFDKGKKTFRNNMYSEYKGTRKPTPAELSMQIPLVHDLVEVFGIRLIEQDGYEADDIIGTLATKAAEAGDEAIIVTGDRDALQLVGKNIKVMLTKKGISEMQMFDEPAFKEKYGLAPIGLIDLKGLMGDSSDNIPGVPGVGEKTATKLLLEYETLENVLENIENISGKKLQERLRENKEQAILSKKLATIVRDMDLTYKKEDFIINPNLVKLKEFCKRYEFRSVLAKIDTLFTKDDSFGFGTVIESVAPEFEVIKESVELEKIIADIQQEKKIYFYPIITGQIPWVELKGMMLVIDSKVLYIDATIAGWEKVIALLEDEQIIKISYAIKSLYHARIHLSGQVFDLMLAAYLLEPSANAYEMVDLMEIYLQEYNQPTSFDDDYAKAAWKAMCIYELYSTLYDKLVKNELFNLYNEIEIPVVAVLAEMENAGVKVDSLGVKQMSAEIANRIDELLKNIYDLAGVEFNVNSTKQLGEVLFERLELPVIKKTKRGYSTDAEVLEKLLPEHPIIEELLEYRMLTKLKSTYLDGLLPLINSETGRVYTSFNQMVTATGRLSSSEPNLQNIPVRTPLGKKIRELFVPGDGYDCLLSADYSQIELRVLAHMSKDKNFVEAFLHNQDIHTRTAAEVFEVPMDQVTSELRGRAKAVNFGIVYGISDYGLSKDLGISRKEAGEYIKNYFEKCAGIKKFIDDVVEQAHKDGFVKTIFGRKRNLPEINSSNYNQRSLAERMAMNTPIQGTAADIIKKAMIEVHAQIKKKNLRSRILLQVHDELVLEAVTEEVNEISKILIQAMSSAANLSVPLTVDINIGENWAKAK